LSKYLGSHCCGAQQGFGQLGLASQQRGFGGQGDSQHESRSQQQLVIESTKAAIKPKPKNFFILNTPVSLFNLRISTNWLLRFLLTL
jgi:hypothetical protein